MGWKITRSQFRIDKLCQLSKHRICQFIIQNFQSCCWMVKVFKKKKWFYHYVWIRSFCIFSTHSILYEWIIYVLNDMLQNFRLLKLFEKYYFRNSSWQLFCLWWLIQDDISHNEKPGTRHVYVPSAGAFFAKSRFSRCTMDLMYVPNYYFDVSLGLSLSVWSWSFRLGH